MSLYHVARLAMAHGAEPERRASLLQTVDNPPDLVRPSQGSGHGHSRAYLCRAPPVVIPTITTAATLTESYAATTIPGTVARSPAEGQSVMNTSSEWDREREDSLSPGLPPRLRLESLPDKADGTGKCPELLPDPFRPRWGQSLRYILSALFLPLVLWGAALGVVFGVARPPPETAYYVAGFAALALATSLWQAAAAAAHARGTALRLGEELPAVIANVAQGAYHAHRAAHEVALGFSPDPTVRYLQACVYHGAAFALGLLRDDDHLETTRHDVLGFLRGRMMALDSDADGYLIIDITGTILWNNPSCSTYFRYDPGELVGKNVRALMPDPYRRQHDSHLQRYDRTGVRKMIGYRRRLPIVDKRGEHRTVLIEVEECQDPKHESGRVFLGKFLLQEAATVVDPVTAIQRKMASGDCDLRACGMSFSTHSEAFLLMNVRGTIEYANDAAELLLGYAFGELSGRSVTAIMPEDQAAEHDGHLAAYVARCEAAQRQKQPVPESTVVGRSREVSCRNKKGDPVRLFLGVKRVDRPSGLVADCCFVATLLVVQDSSRVPTSSGIPTPLAATGRRFSGWALARSVASLKVAKAGLVTPKLSQRRCTVLLIDVCLQDPGNMDALQAEYHAFLTWLQALCTANRAVVLAPAGDRVVVTLNTTVPNNAHRGCAGILLAQLLTACRTHVRAAAASGACVSGTSGKSAVLLTDATDVGAMLLRLGAEAAVQRAMIDDCLFEELQYGYECRLINVVTATATAWSKARTILAYEFCCAKEVEDDEWLYQLAKHDRSDPLASWKACWDALGGDRGALGIVQSDHLWALECLDKHLAKAPRDGPALWLQDAIRQRHRLGRRPTGIPDVAGRLEYVAHLRGSAAPLLSPRGSSHSHNHSVGTSTNSASLTIPAVPSPRDS